MKIIRRNTGCSVLLLGLSLVLTACQDADVQTGTHSELKAPSQLSVLMRTIPADRLYLRITLDSEILIDDEPLSSYLSIDADPVAGSVPVPSQGSAALSIPLSSDPEQIRTLSVAFVTVDEVTGNDVVLAEASQSISGSSSASIELDALDYKYSDDFYNYTGPHGLTEIVVRADIWREQLSDFRMILVVKNAETGADIESLSRAGYFSYYDRDIDTDTGLWLAPERSSLLADNNKWYVYELIPVNAHQCEGWGTEQEVSALQTSLNESALGLFGRFNIEFPRTFRDVMAPLGAGAYVDDMAVIAPSNLGEAPFDNSLKYILVREGAWGWIRVWDKPGGASVANNPTCLYNLTSPAIY